MHRMRLGTDIGGIWQIDTPEDDTAVDRSWPQGQIDLFTSMQTDACRLHRRLQCALLDHFSIPDKSGAKFNTGERKPVATPFYLALRSVSLFAQERRDV